MEIHSKASDAAAVVWEHKTERKQLRRNSFSINIRQMMLNTPSSRQRIVPEIA